MILQKLHATHQGMVRTKRSAQQTVFWPGITNEIVALIESCRSCQKRLSSQPQEPLMRDPLPTGVFEDVSTDLFQSGQLHVLVYADRLSGGQSYTARDTIHRHARSFRPSSKILWIWASLCVYGTMADRNLIPEFSNQRSKDGPFCGVIPPHTTHKATAMRRPRSAQ